MSADLLDDDLFGVVIHQKKSTVSIRHTHVCMHEPLMLTIGLEVVVVGIVLVQARAKNLGCFSRKRIVVNDLCLVLVVLGKLCFSTFSLIEIIVTGKIFNNRPVCWRLRLSSSRSGFA